VVGLLGADVESVYLEGGEMKIEKCGEYKIRDGRKAVIVSLSGCDGYDLIGYVVKSNGTHEIHCWKPNGQWDTGECFLDIIAAWTEPKPPQYVPYTWEDREQLRGRWYRKIHDKDYERMVSILEYSSELFSVNGWMADDFLKNCEWLDGTPCGKVVE
jgi:hypothetical protein